MSPHRFVNLMLMLALTSVMAGRFLGQAKEVSAKREDPPRYIAGCAVEQPKKLLYHRSAVSSVVESSKAATRHFLYHRSVKSCYPPAK